MYKVLVKDHSRLICSHLLADISLCTFNDKLSFKESVSANGKKKQKTDSWKSPGWPLR